MLYWFQNLLNHYSCYHYLTSDHHFGNFGKYAISDCFLIFLVGETKIYPWNIRCCHIYTQLLKYQTQCFISIKMLVRYLSHILFFKKISGWSCKCSINSINIWTEVRNVYHGRRVSVVCTYITVVFGLNWLWHNGQENMFIFACLGRWSMFRCKSLYTMPLMTKIF